MPARAIVPVVRSDGSGSTAQFTLWMIAQHQADLGDVLPEHRASRQVRVRRRSIRRSPGMIAQGGDLGVAGYVSQGFAEGAIGYVNYSYALGVQFPVAKVLNAAGYYTEPTPENVAVSLLQAKINTNEANPATYLTQDLSGVYTDTDPRNYQLSSYSYFILPTKVGGQFNEAQGPHARRVHVLRDVPGAAAVGVARLLADAGEPGDGELRPDRARSPAPRCRTSTCSRATTRRSRRAARTCSPRTRPNRRSATSRAPAQCATGTGGVKAVETPTLRPLPRGGGAAAPGTPARWRAPTAERCGDGGGATGGAATGERMLRPAVGRPAARPAAVRRPVATTAGGAATGGATTATGADGSAVAPTDTTCDPDTGICGRSRWPSSRRAAALCRAVAAGRRDRSDHARPGLGLGHDRRR